MQGAVGLQSRRSQSSRPRRAQWHYWSRAAAERSRTSLDRDPREHEHARPTVIAACGMREEPSTSQSVLSAGRPLPARRSLHAHCTTGVHSPLPAYRSTSCLCRAFVRRTSARFRGRPLGKRRGANCRSSVGGSRLHDAHNSVIAEDRAPGPEAALATARKQVYDPKPVTVPRFSMTPGSLEIGEYGVLFGSRAASPAFVLAQADGAVWRVRRGLGGPRKRIRWRGRSVSRMRRGDGDAWCLTVRTCVV